MPYTPNWQGQLGASQYQINPYLSQNPYQPVMPSQTMQSVNGITKVNGRDSAMQYQLPPNSTSPALFDNNGKVFYVVSTDGTGMKTVEAFDFCPHVDEQPVQIDGAQFVSRQEFEQFTAKVNAALGALNGTHEPVPTTSTTGQRQGANGATPLDDAR